MSTWAKLLCRYLNEVKGWYFVVAQSFFVLLSSADGQSRMEADHFNFAYRCSAGGRCVALATLVPGKLLEKARLV